MPTPRHATATVGAKAMKNASKTIAICKLSFTTVDVAIRLKTPTKFTPKTTKHKYKTYLICLLY